MNRVYTLLFISFILHSTNAISQHHLNHPFAIAWDESKPLAFPDAGEYAADPRLPLFTLRVPANGPGVVSVKVSITSGDEISVEEYMPALQVPRTLYAGGTIEQDKGNWYARIWFVPVILSGEKTATRILSGVLSIDIEPSANSVQRSGPDFKTSSVLAFGDMHKISVRKTGVYKIDYGFIKDKLNIDPSSLDPNRITLYSNGDGRVPQWNNAERIDDLEEVSMMAVGMEDGRIDQGDYYIWYGTGPDQWNYEPAERIYHMDKNIYDEKNHYYLLTNGPQRTSVITRSNVAGGDYISATSLQYQRLEEEKVNLLGRYRSPGSGQEWYGDELAVINKVDYSDDFDMIDMVAADTVFYKARFAARAANVTRFYIGLDGKEFNRSVGGVVLGNFEASFANDAIIFGSYQTTDPVDEIYVRYPDANGVNSRAWLDYLQINFWKQNVYRAGTPLTIRDPRSVFRGKPTYTIENFPATGQIWDITNPLQPINQEFANAQTVSFSVTNPFPGKPAEFMAFERSSDLLIPEYNSVVASQNLHSIERADLVIIYHDDFEAPSLKLADHRRAHSHLEVVAVPVSQVFEEFGGGSMDPSAIRDFARMIYTRDPEFKYLLLVGDATYDYLNRFPEVPYHNFIPAFETEESLDPIRSFPTDDFYALLDIDEGKTLQGALDIGVGRLPVATVEEASALVDKIIYYDTSPATLHDWRQRVVMVADDQDGNVHLNQTDGLAVKKSLDHPDLNIQKIYLDAYPQVSTPGGDRYPSVNADLDLHINKGALTVTYIGHGGQNGWTQERVLGINQAQAYDNLNNLPLFITATCSFAGYDEPSFTTAGEHLLINPTGGAIALMTTVRAVYSGSNERLTRNVLDLIYDKDIKGEYPGVAEILRRSKNVGLDSVDVNARKFTLLGDPSMKLALPEYHVSVSEINGIPANGGATDTLSALEKSVLSGVILDDEGNVMTQFNGRITLTVFDKVQVRKTLANDNNPDDESISIEKPFQVQNTQLFKGAASVTAGEWTIEFVLPKDIDFSYGSGKMSFYAENGVTDAGGYFNSFVIGGVSSEGLADDQPPVIELYMNDDNFVTGGVTDTDPDIYAILMDDYGINVSGAGIGHDLEATLDGDDANSLILNDFYQATQDDYRRGEVRYPLKDLTPGLHTLKLTAWDLANNPSEATIEFLVVDSEEAFLQNVFNYPNPFTDQTTFQFEHNRPGVPMNLRVQIYTIHGQLLKTIEQRDFIAEGYRVDDIVWEGTSDNGNQLAKGIYVFKVYADYQTLTGVERAESEAGKLVILR